MKTYRKAKDITGSELETHIIVEIDGRPVEIITKKHTDKWAEYERYLTKNSEPEADKMEEAPKPKKARGKKKKAE